MEASRLGITYIGGPTSILELGGVRLLTDPTFDPKGGEYQSGPATLRKLAGPAIQPDAVPAFDCVLLSHDHHFDNLDHRGRTMLSRARTVLTTDEGARRLGGNSLGLKAWHKADIATPDGRVLRIVGTPARHVPERLQRGTVTGFVLYLADAPETAVYVSGDTVWYECVAEVARRFRIKAAILHVGAAVVPEIGSFHLTMTADEAVDAARAFADAAIVPVHFEDWAHFSEGRAEILRAFRRARLETRLRWPDRGRQIVIDLA
jgi:L-ascorbate metabolism protein UlaG (beta-lactamase superfamily)